MNSYDSTLDTFNHKQRVMELMNKCIGVFLKKALVHDNSKLSVEEKTIFDTYTPKLKKTTYDSEEYKEYLKEMKRALEHHYMRNSHHPEHYNNGIDGMDLFDIFEMLLDWQAAGERHNDGDIIDSLIKNTERFSITPQLNLILLNTVERYPEIFERRNTK